MVYTITLSPALDKTIYVDELNVGNVNVYSETLINAGGKGINTAKILNLFGTDVVSISVLGGETGKEIEKQLNNANIKQENIYVENNTRTNLKIVSNLTSECTEINETPTPLTDVVVETFMDKYSKILDNADYITLSGRLVGGVELDFYKTLIEKANNKGAKVVLDTSGEPLKYGIEAKPWCIKPNIHELSEYFGTEILTEDELIKKCKLLNEKVEVVIVTRGGEGSICTTKDKTFIINTPKVKVQSTVGAGDSFVGGFLSNIIKTNDLQQALQFGSAVATAKVTQKGTSTPNIKLVNELLNQVEVKEI